MEFPCMNRKVMNHLKASKTLYLEASAPRRKTGGRFGHGKLPISKHSNQSLQEQ